MPEACSHKDCDSQATDYPKVLIPPKGLYDMAESVKVVPKFPVCDRCKPEFQVQDILTAELKNNISGALRGMGKAKADFKKARVEWVAIDGGDHPYGQDSDDA